MGGRISVGNIVLDSDYVGQTMDFTVVWLGANLADLGLANGQSRILEFDDGSGGREAIRWNVAVVPEPSAFIYGGLIGAMAGCGRWVKRRLA